MKKAIKSFLIILFFAACSLLITSCFKQDEVISVRFRNDGMQTEYNIGDELNLKGAKIVIEYTFETESIDITKDMIGEYDFSTPGKKTIVAKATISEKEYTVTFNVVVLGDVVVTFNTDGGSEVDSQYLLYGDKTTKPTTEPTKEGYTFKGWFTDNETFEHEFVFNQEVLHDTTVYAKWEANKYTVTFDAGMGAFLSGRKIVKEITYPETFEKLVSEIETPVREGYTFKQWRLNNEPFDAAKPIADNIVLVAEYTINTYKVIFNANGGHFENNDETITQNVNYNEQAQKPSPAPTLEGYDFDGWFEVGKDEEYDFGTPVKGNVNLQAKWSAHEYTITFDAKDGHFTDGATKDVKVSYENTISMPENPRRIGYKFETWYYENKPFDFSKTLKEANIVTDITLEAHYIETEITLSVKDGGKDVSSVNREWIKDQLVVFEITVTNLELEGELAYEWYKDSDLKADAKDAEISINEINESGTYYCKVIITVGEEHIEKQLDEVTINITRIKQEITSDNLSAVNFPAYLDKKAEYGPVSIYKLASYTIDEAMNNVGKPIVPKLVKENEEQDIKSIEYQLDGKSVTKDELLKGAKKYTITVSIEESEHYTSAKLDIVVVLYNVVVNPDNNPQYYGSLAEAIDDTNKENANALIRIIGPAELNEDKALENSQTLELEYLYPVWAEDINSVNDFSGITPYVFGAMGIIAGFPDFPLKKEAKFDPSSYESKEYNLFNTVKGNGSITATKGSEIVETMFFTVFMNLMDIVGGSINPNTKFGKLATLLKDIEKNPIPEDFTFFPFDIFTMHSYQVNITVEYGATYKAKPVFNAGVSFDNNTFIPIPLPEKVALAEVDPIVASSKDNNALITLLDTGSSFTKSYEGDAVQQTEKVSMEIKGNAEMSEFSITLHLFKSFFILANKCSGGTYLPKSGKEIVKIKSVPFEIMSNGLMADTEINLVGDSTLTLNRDLSILEGVTVNLKGNSTLVVNGAFSGKVNAEPNAKVKIGSTADLGVGNDVIITTTNKDNIELAKELADKYHLYNVSDNDYSFHSLYTLTFDATDCSQEADVKAFVDEDIELPTPTKDGYTFKGWFYDKECTKLFDFKQMPELTDPEYKSGWVPLASNINKYEYVECFDSTTCTLKLYAKWELDAPAVSSSTNEIDLTYDGASHTLEVVANHALQDKLTYQWYKGDPKNGGELLRGVTTATLVMSNFADSGVYYCVVTVIDGDLTKTVTSDPMTVTIRQKEVTVTWPEFKELEYNATDQMPKDIQVNGLTGLDDVNYKISVNDDLQTIIDAGTYNFNVTLNGEKSSNYKVTNGEYTLTITPKVLEIDWKDGNYWTKGLVYNAQNQMPQKGVNVDVNVLTELDGVDYEIFATIL